MKLSRTLLAGTAFALALTGAATAQESFFERDRYEAVTERAQPEYDPLAKRVGAFEIQPTVEVGAGYTSNLFASGAGEVDDFFFRLAPSLTGNTTWSRHRLGFNARLGRTEWIDTGSESTTDYGAGIDGRVDVTSRFNLTGGLRGEQSFESRSAAASVPNADEPVKVTRVGGDIGSNFESGRLQLRGRISVDDFKFDDVELRSGGVEDQSFRDRVETEGVVRAAVAVERDWAIFGEARVIDRSYDAPLTPAALNRDSQGTVFLVGTDFELSSLIRGEFAVGYQTFEYDDARLTDVDGLSVDGRINWFVTELTTLTARGVRTVIDPGLQASAGSTLTGFDLRADHELRRNLLLFGEVNYANFDFESINREDDRWIAGFGTTWKLNRKAWLEAGYRYTTQESNFQDFTDNRLSVTLKIYP